MSKRPGDFIYDLLETSIGSGDLTVDGSMTPVEFFYTCPTGYYAELSRVTFAIVDGSIVNGAFAGIAGGLTNGLLIEIVDNDGVTVLQDFSTNDYPIKINADWSLLAGVDTVIHPAAGDDALPVRWTIAKSGAELRLAPGEALRVTVQDDLTPLTVFKAMVQGILHPVGGSSE